MQMILVLFFLVVPLLISFLTQRFSLLNKLGSVLVCYAVGLIVGHSPFINNSVHQIQDIIINASILIALPILLLDTRAGNLKQMAGITILSMLVAIVALVTTVIAGYYWFGSDVTESWKVSGMLVGLYTGGTPNLASIKTALDVSDDLYIGVHTFDTALGAMYLLFLLSFGKNLFRRWLPKYQSKNRLTPLDEIHVESLSFNRWLSDFDYAKSALVLLIGLIIAAAGAGIGILLPESYQMTAIILLITTLGIGASFYKGTARLSGGFKVGMYLINVFSLTIASRANFFEIVNLDSILFGYVLFVLVITFVFHVILSKLLRVDSDTMMITSVALICSPPFVPVISGALKNRELLLPGITVGIIGYAMGNYLGVLIAYLLK